MWDGGGGGERRRVALLSYNRDEGVCKRANCYDPNCSISLKPDPKKAKKPGKALFHSA